MAQHHLTATTRVAWWVRPYIKWLALYHAVTGTQPNWERIERVTARGVKVTFS